MTDALETLRYPIGRFQAPEPVAEADRRAWIRDLERLPALLRRAVEPLAPGQLDTPYRPGGWSVRQVVHHLADSHLNSFVRFKLALTEDRPTIKPYDEAAWAELPDVAATPVAVSLDLLEALHARWVHLLGALDERQLAREFLHPESGTLRLDHTIGLYAWHGRHHLAHVTTLAEREGWASA